MENFKKITGYDNYSVSDLGRVRNDKTGKILRPVANKNRYLIVCLYCNGKQKNEYIHRLVAKAFIENPNNLETVNHVNFDVTDNRVCNLEWMTAYDNNANKEINCKTVIIQLTLDGEIVNTFKSTCEAERQTGIYQTNIVSAYNGRYKTAGGFRWLRINVDEYLKNEKYFSLEDISTEPFEVTLGERNEQK